MKRTDPACIKAAVIPFVLLICLAIAGCSDRVALINGSGLENGLLLDGRYGSVYRNDRTFVSASSVVRVGRVASGVNNEVVAFSRGRPVALKENAAWTGSDNDRITVQYADTIGLRVKVWIVKGPYDAQRQKALNAYAATASIWTDERTGLEFTSFEIADATANPKSPDYFDFYCSKQSALENDIGKAPGMINIYYVDRVGGGPSSVGTGTGWSCKNDHESDNGGDFVAMGSATGDELLAHELGHSFALQHTNGLTGYDATNVMHNASNTREFLTEGQTFRLHMLAGSAINDANIYGARPGLTTRDCRINAASEICVDNKKRIWADGAFPAN